jgi:hypothetical protein
MLKTLKEIAPFVIRLAKPKRVSAHIRLSIRSIEEEHQMVKAILGLALSLALASTATAQTAPGTCGILTWSQADQKHAILPCTPQGRQAADGSAQCGIVTWSQAEQKHSVVPCTVAGNGAGGQSCAQSMWSQADQRHVTIPCDAPNKSGLSAPVHFGE